MENLCYAFYKAMSEASEKKEAASERDLPQWSVVSFDACEGSRLTYHEAAKLMAEKDAAGVYGLCIITDEAASRVCT